MVGLEILDGLSTVLRCSLKRSVSHRLVSPMFGAVVALYHVDGVCFLVTVRMWWVIGLVSPVEWNVYEVCPSDMYLQVRQFFPHGYKPRGWLCRVRLRSLALTRKSLRLGLKVTSPQVLTIDLDLLTKQNPTVQFTNCLLLTQIAFFKRQKNV